MGILSESEELEEGYAVGVGLEEVEQDLFAHLEVGVQLVYFSEL